MRERRWMIFALAPVILCASCSAPSPHGDDGITLVSADRQKGLEGSLHKGGTVIRFFARVTDGDLEAFIDSEAGECLAEVAHPFGDVRVHKIAGIDTRFVDSEAESRLRALATRYGPALRELALRLVEVNDDPALMHERAALEMTYQALQIYMPPLAAEDLGGSCAAATADYEASCSGGFMVTGQHAGAGAGADHHRDPGACLGACGWGCNRCTYRETLVSVSACMNGTYTETWRHTDSCQCSPACATHDACTRIYGWYDPACIILFPPALKWWTWTPCTFNHTATITRSCPGGGTSACGGLTPCATSSECGPGRCCTDCPVCGRHCWSSCASSPMCGNGVCDPGETASSCPPDCGGGMPDAAPDAARTDAGE